MKKNLLLLLCIFSINAFSQKQVSDTIKKATKELPQGTQLKAKLIETIKGGSVEVGQQVKFELAEPLIFGDVVYLHKGLKISGFITDAKASGVLGRKGKLAFSINYLYLPDGKVIKLRGEQQKKLNGSGVTVAAASVLLTPVALLIPGKGAKYEEGTLFDVWTDENIMLN